ncbi:Conserved_hypothetical protein [Hexamita inflata]|uniref:Uncharacterized protein n=1 Tax=Hexamita inflata TaxID=28002 RepID=A0AA86RPE2_9EUKA|nr:Conserved hypothetical protein [Hexamita inflata]
MICLTIILSDVVQQTFKSCFSPRSFLRGNIQTNQLTLHMIPFEHIDEVKEYNQCKTALDKMNVQVFLHFDSVSFPRANEPQVYFKYAYNQETQVVFKVPDADYAAIVNKRTAVFELRYDITYVIVNSSVAAIEHTKYNGTGCFADIAMKYTMYGDIELLATPNECVVNFAAGVTVSFDYTSGSQNKQIPVRACTAQCQDGEYNASSTNFVEISLYRVRKEDVDAQLLSDFYAAFVANRLVKVSLNLRFDTNGVQTTITQFISNKTASDTLGCVANDQVTDTYYGLSLFTILNSDGAMIQIRDVLTNKMNCDTLAAAQVKLDHYMVQSQVVDRRQLTVPLAAYNEQIGLQLQADESYENFREKVFVSQETHSLIVLSFQDANGVIVYEICTYILTSIGCFEKQQLHLYKDKQCLRVQFEPLEQCRSQQLNATDRNSIALYYQDGTKYIAVGQYNLRTMMNYSQYDLEICYDCANYDETQTYAESSCSRNYDLFKKKLTNSNVFFVYTSFFEQITSSNVLTEYQTIFVPLIITAVILAAFVVVLVSVVSFR